MLNIVLADSELELIPSKIHEQPIIKRSAKKSDKNPSEMLLDSNYHHKAMKNLNQSERRGRPDIVHISLLCALESILNKEKDLNLFIHTRNDKVIEIDPETRLPRSYNRFIGLFEKLFKTKTVPKDLKLLKLEDNTLKSLLIDLKGEKLVMTGKGEKVTELKKLFPKSEDTTVIIGGFPKGDYISNPKGKKISIYNEQLTAWATLNEVISEYERA